MSNDQSAQLLTILDGRGFTKAAAALREEIRMNGGTAPPPAAGNGAGGVVGLQEFADRNAPKRMGNRLMQDSTSWEKGYGGLRAFIENSLDMHRLELQPILLPLFVHSYTDLVLMGFIDSADSLLKKFSDDHNATSPHIVKLLSSIRTAAHVQESTELNQWRSQRFSIEMSERGWNLLLSWLNGGAMGDGEYRGRDRMLALINEKVRVDTTPGGPSAILPESGLAQDLNFKNKAQSEIKLGPAPLEPRLEKEVLRVIKDDPTLVVLNPKPVVVNAEGEEEDTGPTSITEYLPPPVQQQPVKEGEEFISPTIADLPPYSASLRTIDISREISKLKEAQRRIRLGPEAYENSTFDLNKKEDVFKPSVCLFTIHDSGESLVNIEFSEDSTLMAAGFAESYIRLWSLKNEPLAGIRPDFDGEVITDADSLKKIREPDAPTTRKLISHSGPVYGLSFDPIPGPCSPPRYLLSSSADSTIRLWSLETFTPLAIYRGHRGPVWSVEWGPKGIYFASGGWDRTLRVWVAEKDSAVRVMAGHGGDVNCVKFHPNSLYVVSGSGDRTCRMWDIQRGICVRVFMGHIASVMALAISPDGRLLASAAEDRIIIHDIASTTVIKTFNVPQPQGNGSSVVHSLSFSAESSILVSGSSDGSVRIWAINSNVHDKRVSVLPVGIGEKEEPENSDLLGSLITKRTPVVNLKFTPRNLVLAAGPFMVD